MWKWEGGSAADDEGLLGSDGEDGAGEGAEAVDGDAAVPAVNGIAVSIGRGYRSWEQCFRRTGCQCRNYRKRCPKNLAPER